VNFETRSSPRVIWEPSTGMVEQDCACAVEIPRLRATAEDSATQSGERVETDCACPSTSTIPKEIQALPSAALWQLPPTLHRAPLPQSHELAFNPDNPTGLAVLNQPARHILDSFATPRPLTDSIESQLATLHLIQPANLQLTNLPLADLPPATLTAWLHVTNQCNLNCSYCYVHKSNEAMSESTGRAAVDAAFRAARANDFRSVKLKYAGGEPTLNFPLVRSLHEHAQKLADERGLELREVLLSNGVALTDVMITALLEMDMRLAISLDGVGAAHDALRGAGTFARVAHSIERALDLGLKPHLSITVTAQNADALPDAVEYALERDLLFNLNFYREHCGSKTVQRADNVHLIEGLRAALDVIEEKMPHQNVIGGLMDRAILGAAHKYPCGAGRNYLVIDQRGRISRCQMTMDRPVTDIRADDPLQAVREGRDDFQNISVDEKAECRDCPWRYWCAGGCPLLAHHTSGRSDVSSPYCNVYKALFPDLLRLEGLRLLNTAPRDIEDRRL